MTSQPAAPTGTFRVHPPFTLPDLTGAGTDVSRLDRGGTCTLRTVYWDTADLRLTRNGVSLRYRLGAGKQDGWQLTLPVLRDEMHAAGPADAVPEDFRALLTAYLRGATLRPVATLDTTRSSYVLVSDEQQTLAEITEDQVSAVGSGHDSARFREFTVKDRGGGPRLLQHVAAVLRDAGAVEGWFIPKVVSILGPQAIADPDLPLPGEVNRSDAARQAMQAMLRRQVRRLVVCDVALRLGEDDAVHQMRVAARRLRSSLKTFPPLLDDAWAESLCTEVSWVAESLGGARDNGVLLDRLHRDLASLPPELVIGPVNDRIDQAIGGDLAAAVDEAASMLTSDRYVALVDRLVLAARDPTTTDVAVAPVGAVIPPVVNRAWKRLARRARRLSEPDCTNADWHRTRIAAKQVRYAAEAVQPFFGEPARDLAEQAEAVQELLGEHQDAVVAADVIRDLASQPEAGDTAFTLGLLHAMQQDAAARCRAAFPRIWSAAAKPKHRSWLRDA